jgi:hypothetical protein
MKGNASSWQNDLRTQSPRSLHRKVVDLQGHLQGGAVTKPRCSQIYNGLRIVPLIYQR